MSDPRHPGPSSRPGRSSDQLPKRTWSLHTRTQIQSLRCLLIPLARVSVLSLSVLYPPAWSILKVLQSCHGSNSCFLEYEMMLESKQSWFSRFITGSERFIQHCPVFARAVLVSELNHQRSSICFGKFGGVDDRKKSKFGDDTRSEDFARWDTSVFKKTRSRNRIQSAPSGPETC